MEWVNTHVYDDKFITSVDTLMDGRIVYSDVMGNVCVWDHTTGQTFRWKAHSHWIECVAVLPYGKIASSARDGTIKIWTPLSADYKRLTFQELKYRPENFDNRSFGSVNNITYRGLLVTSHQHKRIKIFSVNVWDLKKGIVSRSKRFSGLVYKTAIQTNGDRIYVGHKNKISVWDVSVPDANRQMLYAHNDDVTSIAVWGSDKLISGSNDKTVKIWKLSNNLWSVEQTLSTISKVRYVCNASLAKVICALDNRKIKVWNTKTGKVQTVHVDEPIGAIEWYNGKIISGSTKSIKIWTYSKPQMPVVKLGYKTFPSGSRLFTLITSETFDRTRDLAFFGKHLGLNVRATLHNTSGNNYVWLHVFNTTGPLRMLTAPNHWRQAIYGPSYISLAEVERRLTKYCKKNGYDGWHMRVKMDNRVSNVKEAEYETVVLKSSFDKLQFRGKKRITLEDLKDKDHVRVSKNGKITFIKRIERLEEMFENLRF